MVGYFKFGEVSVEPPVVKFFWNAFVNFAGDCSFFWKETVSIWDDAYVAFNDAVIDKMVLQTIC
jgi:hypothetical protein